MLKNADKVCTFKVYMYIYLSLRPCKQMRYIHMKFTKVNNEKKSSCFNDFR